MRKFTLSPSLRATDMVAALLTILLTILGLQLIRVFIPTLLFYLGHNVGLNTIPMALVGALTFLAAFLAAPLQKLLGLRLALALTAAGTALLRAAEQLSVSPPIDLALGMTGAAFFLLYLPLMLGAARAVRPARVTGFAFALLLGVAADTAIHIAAGTYDLSWQGGLLPALIVLALTAAALVVLAVLLPTLPRQAAGVPWRRAWPLLVAGPWLALQLLVFQNPARAAALTGWSLPAAAFLITAGNILGLGAAWVAVAWPRWMAMIAGAALVLLFVPTNPVLLGAAFVTLAGQLLSAALFVRALRASATESPPAGLGRTTVAYGLGQLLFILLFFGYNAPYNLVVPFSSATIVLVTALLLALPAALAPVREGYDPARLRPGFILAVTALLLAPAGLVLAWQQPRPVPPPSSNEVLRVLDYNLHNGFNIAGRLDMEALAGVIESTNPDVITLQEVSRGWAIAGSLDMLAWLAQRLDMPYVFGPTTADHQWGNAILSRYPIVAVDSGPLPSTGLPLQRGYLRATVDAGPVVVQVMSTHLHHIASESEIRQQQVPALLAAWDHAGRTIIAGDFNAPPSSPEMGMMVDATLVDVAAQLADGPAYTSPADAPNARIDYIWLSPDLLPQAFFMPQSTASDHLPLFTEVRLPAD